MPEQTEQSAKKSNGNALTALIAAFSWRARALMQKVSAVTAKLGVSFRHAVGYSQPETTLIGDSQTFWNAPPDRALKQNSHWRGAGIFADDSRWLAIGQEHLQIYQEFARAVNANPHPKRVLEWGCGGGLNAVHFGRFTGEFCGLDISADSLAECARQMKAEGLDNFKPILIDAANPEAALTLVPGPCDLFISTYVFELLPTPEYGLRVLRVANQLLEAGGMAVIQIKYSEANRETSSRRWSYAKNLAWNATYRIEEFWEAAERCGFTSKMVTLQQKQPLVNDRNYAYFLLLKKGTA